MPQFKNKEEYERWKAGRKKPADRQVPNPTPKPPASEQDVGTTTAATWKEIGGKIENNDVNHFITKTIVQDEEILATAVGLGGDFLLVTNKKVAIIKKGPAAWATGGFGLKTKSFILSNIASTDVHKRLMTCDLEIVSAGMVEKSHGGFFSSAGSESIFQFEQQHYEDMLNLVNDIRALIYSAKSPPAAQAVGLDIPSQIEKLAKLKEQGIISTEEFETKKQDLLSRL